MVELEGHIKELEIEVEARTAALKQAEAALNEALGGLKVLLFLKAKAQKQAEQKQAEEAAK